MVIDAVRLGMEMSRRGVRRPRRLSRRPVIPSIGPPTITISRPYIEGVTWSGVRYCISDGLAAETARIKVSICFAGTVSGSQWASPFTNLYCRVGVEAMRGSRRVRLV